MRILNNEAYNSILNFGIIRLCGFQLVTNNLGKFRLETLKEAHLQKDIGSVIGESSLDGFVT